MKQEYIFVLLGGGWTYISNLYYITKDKIYFKRNIDVKDLENFKNLDYDIIVDHDNSSLDFEKHSNTVGFDAPDITMYRVTGNSLKMIWRVGDYHNSEAVDIIEEIIGKARYNKMIGK